MGARNQPAEAGTDSNVTSGPARETTSRAPSSQAPPDALRTGGSDQDLDALSLDALRNRLGARPEGLTAADAAQRLQTNGPNELEEARVSPLRRFLMAFWGPIPWMIEAAAILSAIAGRWPDFIIISVLLVANAIVGFWEEYHAGNAIAALKARLAPKARVKRDGAWSTIAARELVPGDVIRLRIGDVAPADARVLSGGPLEMDQSALTGESLPVKRGPGESVLSGAITRKGEADALVYATGVHTFFGRTAQLVAETRIVSHFQKAVMRIGNFLIVIAIILVTLIVVVAAFRGRDLMTEIQFALVLTVAAIPVALPTVLSVTMAVGARTLARRQAVVARLAAIEEMAGIDVLCSDKTGTLTRNSLTAAEPFLLPGVSSDDLLQAAALASRAEDEDPIDRAVLESFKGSLDGLRVTGFVPFDPVQKRTEATVTRSDGGAFTVTKGAPQVILALVPDAEAIRAQVEQAVDQFAARGFRSLGVAQRDGAGAWKLLGILPLYDPPREDSLSTIRAARELGLQVKMVTGDQIAIAREIAHELEIGSSIVDASVFSAARPSDPSPDQGRGQQPEIRSLVEQADGFAQVFPEHKYRIVEVLQQQGHLVGMTGDGVNDAPALKKADAGIAVSGATDAARAAADIVLLAPGLSVVVDAIREARRIFQRMNTYTIYRIAETIRILLFMTLAILVFNFYPITAVMIVLLALLNDGAILSIAYDRVRPSPRPDVWNMRRVLGLSSVLGLVGVVASFGLFYLGERVYHLDRDAIQTLMYLKLSVAGHLTIFVTRTRGPFWSTAPAPILILAVAGTQLVATLVAVYGFLMTPIGWKAALAVWGYALAWFVISDVVKLIAYRVFDPPTEVQSTSSVSGAGRSGPAAASTV